MSSPYRQLAVLGAGPICSECTHVATGGMTDRPDLWRCRAIKVIERPAVSKHIDGRAREAVISFGWCVHHNDKGQCKAFASQDGRKP